MVRKDERGEGKFDAQTKALELATYTVNITDNPKSIYTRPRRHDEEDCGVCNRYIPQDKSGK